MFECAQVPRLQMHNRSLVLIETLLEKEAVAWGCPLHYGTRFNKQKIPVTKSPSLNEFP
jgi:hypothetical protein